MDYPLLIEVEAGLSKNQYSNLLQTKEIPRGLTIPINSMLLISETGVSMVLLNKLAFHLINAIRKL